MRRSISTVSFHSPPTAGEAYALAFSELCGRTASSAARAAEGNRIRRRPRPTAAPASCARTNAGTEDGAMPAKVSLKMRPTVTAGFAKDVEQVNQYAAPI